MEFSWTEEQLEFKDCVLKFAEKELNNNDAQCEKREVFPRENWQKCADFGIQGITVPEKYGGSEQDIITAMLAMEALGYGCHDTGLPFGLSAQMWSVQYTIQKFGTEEQKQKYLPGFCEGRLIGAQAITEPEAGSDMSNLQTYAKKQDNGYVINGTKTMVTLAPVSNVAVVFATVDRKMGKWGITAFLVEKGTVGFQICPELKKMGMRNIPMGDLVFEECFIPEENRLGPEGAGTSFFNSAMESERGCIFASQLGAMERQLERCVNYTRQRRQFGQTIGKFQSVSNRIADMKVRLETARLLLYKVGWLRKMNKNAVMEAAMAKLYFSECFVQSSMDAIRVHGGYGYMDEFEVERDLRDSVGGVLYAGTSDIQRNIIAGLLGL